MTTKSDIERVLWNACDSFRGKIEYFTLKIE